MRRKGKEKTSSKAPVPIPPSNQPDTFFIEKAQEHYRKVEKKTFHYERKLNLPDKYAEAITNRLDYYGWKFIEFNPVEVNEYMVKEFYGNLPNEGAESVFLRGMQLDTSNHALEALLPIPHIPESEDDYIKIAVDLIQGKIRLDAVLEKIGLPEARWEYSRGEKAVPLSIACSYLHPEARI
ncbi:uncharacterized protein [Arachis hypogaea]|uniref:Uncharacterized protein n=1 Tax=Arachis hypogaea TaxID=3818 RepID=A0A445A2Z9_ARAHY|nr:uncharacterized protein LOC112738086 [Arachis hypogaea]QHO00981.1 uncharacterized protein DS421_13g411010 [Arachis hypogaea]RYR20799.1 hypothetical protein Ahy_B03g066046 [Arachis hypogaea]